MRRIPLLPLRTNEESKKARTREQLRRARRPIEAYLRSAQVMESQAVGDGVDSLWAADQLASASRRKNLATAR